MTERFLAIFIGYILDLIIGDPRWLYHPVCAIGKLIAWNEKLLRKLFGVANIHDDSRDTSLTDNEGKKEEAASNSVKKREFIAGILMVILTVAIVFLISFGILYIAGKINHVVSFIVETIFCYQILAVKSLKSESMKVYERLSKNDIEGARYNVSMIVGRDTAVLDREGIIKATVETVAENTSDGVIAPIFFMALGGAVGGFIYKAINTMDSMIGYKNDKYLYFGRAAAKLDDIVNYIPARLAAVYMIIASFILKLDVSGAIRIFKRDRKNHASPNSAQTESVCAGALDVQLAGDAYYFGKLYKKKTIGDDIRKIRESDIIAVNRMMYVASLLSIISTAIILFL